VFRTSQLTANWGHELGDVMTALNNLMFLFHKMIKFNDYLLATSIIIIIIIIISRNRQLQTE